MLLNYLCYNGISSRGYTIDDGPKGGRRALRLAAGGGVNFTLSADPDNPEITIVTFTPSSSESVARLTKTASFTVDQLGQLSAPLYFIDATAGNMVITMPSTTLNKNKYQFIRIDKSRNTVKFVGALGTERFGGDGFDTFLFMKQAEDFEFFTDYTDWFI